MIRTNTERSSQARVRRTEMIREYGTVTVVHSLSARHEARGTLRHGDAPYRVPVPEPSELRFPAKMIRYGEHLLVADAGHHQIV